jgi:hypothetical protein
MTEKNTPTEELDCEVTVRDGSWMTCDMVDQNEDNAEQNDSSGDKPD